MRALSVMIGAATVALAGCVSLTPRPSVDGNWASDDGVFVATFRGGAFTSRLTGTGETVVADGRYARTPNGLNLSWTSIAANEQRGANCVLTAPRRLACAPTVGEPFTMTRIA